MKKIFFTLISIFVFAISAFAQSENSACPKIEIEGGGIVQEGERIFFSVKLSGTNTQKVDYKWTVSNGVIFGAKDLPTVYIDTTGLAGGTNVKAEVKLKGLPENCANTISEVGSVMEIIKCGLPPIQYSRKVSYLDETAILDGLRIQLANNPKSEGFIVISLAKNETVAQAKKHIARIIKIMKFLKIQPELITFGIEETDSDYGENKGWIIPEGADFPCDKCTIIKAEEFKDK